MTFPAIRALWADGTRLYAAELDALDQYIQLALDSRGGVYAAVDPIVFSGAAWTLPSLNITGTLAANGPVTLGDSAADAITLNGTVTANANVALNGDAVIGSDGTDTLEVNAVTTINSAVTANGNLTVNGNATFNGTSLFNGNTVLGDVSGDTVEVKGAATFTPQARFVGGLTTYNGVSAYGGIVSGNLTANGTMIVNGALASQTMTASAGSSIPKKLYTWSEDDNQEFGFGTGNFILIPSGVITATRNLTLHDANTPGTPAGATYELFSSDTTHAVNVLTLESWVGVGGGGSNYRYLKLLATTAGLHIVQRVAW